MLCFFYKAKPWTSDFSRPSAFAFVYLWISSLEAQSVLYRSNRKISAVFSSPSWAPLVQCERSNKLYSARLAIRQFVKKSWRGEGIKKGTGRAKTRPLVTLTQTLKISKSRSGRFKLSKQNSASLVQKNWRGYQGQKSGTEPAQWKVRVIPKDGGG